MYTSPKFESEEAARSTVERLKNQQPLLFGCHGGQLPPVQCVDKTHFGKGSTALQTLCAANLLRSNGSL